MTYTEPGEETAPVAFEIEVTLKSPVCLSSGVPTGNLTRTLDYIPGSAVRGMLAQYYLDHVGSVDENFERLFLSGEVLYGNLYLRTTEAMSAPTPLSARSCKHEAGFKSDEDMHGVVDLLIQTLVCKLTEQETLLPQDTCGAKGCGAPLERFTKFYEAPHGRNQTVPTEKLHRLLTRAATNDRLQTAEKGLLYSLEVLDPTASTHSPATGQVFCLTERAAQLTRQKLLNPAFADKQTSFLIGTARSRGLGEVVSPGRTLETLDPFTHPFSLAQRVRDFNHVLKEGGADGEKLYFSLTLHADAIVQDEFFRFHSTIHPSLLAMETGIDAEKLRLLVSFTGVHVVSGWNTALRAPKSDVAAIKMGAAFLYAVEGIDEQTLVEKLGRLEWQGLGARRIEGFGRVKVCDPFHVEAGKEQV